MSGPRIPFPDAATLDAGTVAQLARRPPIDLYRMVSHSPPLLEPFLSLVVANFSRLAIPPAVREAVILRVGAHHASAYELHHHRRMARDAGVDPAAIEALVTGSPAGGLPAALQAPIALADALLQGRRVDDALLARIVDGGGPRAYVELALLVGFYRMVATFLDAVGIEPEPDGVLAGWRPPAA